MPSFVPLVDSFIHHSTYLPDLLARSIIGLYYSFNSRFHLNNDYLQTYDLCSSYVTTIIIQRKEKKMLARKSLFGNQSEIPYRLSNIQTCRKKRRVNCSACYRLDSKIRSVTRVDQYRFLISIPLFYIQEPDRPAGFHRGNGVGILLALERTLV